MVTNIHSDARIELRHSTLYYESFNPGLSARFRESIKASIALAIESPLRFPRIEDNVRRVLVPVFPYAALYSIEENGINILAVMHCARKPGYWKNRR